MRSTTLLTSALSASTGAFAQGNGTSAYILKDDLSYNNFFSNFDFYSGPDPTQGFVQYQTKDAAIDSELVGYFEDTESIFLGVDYKEKDPKGRKSVRVESTKTWNQGLLVADIRHMPDSTCGSWPAYWLLGQQTVGTDDWPKGGEIDLLEGVNLDTVAAVTLHTSEGCVVNNATSGIQGQVSSEAAAFMGSMSTSNCDVAAEGQGKNVGCSIKAPELQAKNGMATYGTEFNNAGGGVYAMEWTDTSIAVWFIPRDSATYKSNFGSQAATQSLDPSTFGTPLAKFQGQGCDFTERFKNMRIIFDTTFCGEWAGKVWEESTCAAKTGAATCQEYVQNNPEVFADAYWEIGALKWFEKQGAGEAPGAPAQTPVQPPVASSAPVASAPVESSPIASAPVASTPIASAPVASTPISSEPVASAPVASPPIESAPVASTPIASTPVASTPVDSPPVASPPAASLPVASQPAASVPLSSASPINAAPSSVAQPSSAAPAPSSSAAAPPASSPAAAPTGSGSGTGSSSGGGMSGFTFPSSRGGAAKKRSRSLRRSFRW